MSRSPAEKRAVPQPGEGWLHRLINLAVTLLLWAYFTIGFVLLFAPFYLLAAIVAGDRTKAFQRLNHLFYRGFFLLCRLVMPRQNWVVDPALRRLRGSVVVCNHLSYIDPLLLISLFPRHSTIVKNRLFHIPIFGWMLGLSGYLPASSKGRLAERMIVNMERMPDFLADAGQLTQAVLNLVRNAWQACGDGGLITLKTRVYRQFTVGGNRHKLVCALHISDNGPGVPEDLLPMLFLPMVTGNAKGTGLGLSIAQRIANQHGGLIQVQSVPGDTCFTLLLPMET